jgi:hypothetical protein
MIILVFLLACSELVLKGLTNKGFEDRLGEMMAEAACSIPHLVQYCDSLQREENLKPPTTEETVQWKSIELKTEPYLFEHYLRRYPKGAFSVIARRKLEETSHHREEIHQTINDLRSKWPTAPANQCDRLVTMWDDVLSLRAGKPAHEIDDEELQGYAPEAKPACADAVEKFPNVLRFIYQLACATGDCDYSYKNSAATAKSLPGVLRAAEMSYPAAQVSQACVLGLLKGDTQIQAKELFNAGVRTYERLADIGDKTAMTRLGWIYQFCFNDKLELVSRVTQSK